MLIQQQEKLVFSLQVLYKRGISGEGRIGNPLEATSHDYASVKHILKQIRPLLADKNAINESFEEDFNVMQQRLILEGADFMRQNDNSKGGTDTVPSPIPDPIPPTLLLSTDLFTSNDFPSTSLKQSLHLQTTHFSASVESQSHPQPPLEPASLNPTLLERQIWDTQSVGVDENLNFVDMFSTAKSINILPPQYSQSQCLMGIANLSLPVWSWREEEDVETYCKPQMVMFEHSSICFEALFIPRATDSSNI